MADSKITALTALTAADPANDMMPIVDVSDTSMAASGTTKRISINNILACSPSATLASATITGDLTVDTSTLKVDSANDRVGIKNASPTYTLDVTGTANDVAIGTRLAYGTAGEVYSAFRFNNTSFAGGNSEIRNIVNGSSTTGSSLAFFTTQQGGSTLTERYRLDTNGVATWSNVGGVAGTAMTLDSTGLGVGGSPVASKVEVYSSNTGTSGLAEANALKVENNNATVGNAAGLFLSQSGNAGCGVAAIATSRTGGSRASALSLYYYNQATSASPIEGARIDASGNLIVNGTNSFAKISSYVTSSGTFQSAFGATNGSNSDFVVRVKTSVSDVYNSVGSLTFSTGGTGGTERVRIKDTGQVRFVPLASDPSGAEAGDVYYNSVSNRLKYYNGTAWTLI
jgi:hypothetical protein